MISACVLIVLHSLRSTAKLIFKAAETPYAPNRSETLGFMQRFLATLITNLTLKI